MYMPFTSSNCRMAGNIDVELYLAVDEIKPVSQNFNPPA